MGTGRVNKMASWARKDSDNSGGVQTAARGRRCVFLILLVFFSPSPSLSLSLANLHTSMTYFTSLLTPSSIVDSRHLGRIGQNICAGEEKLPSGAGTKSGPRIEMRNLH